MQATGYLRVPVNASSRELRVLFVIYVFRYAVSINWRQYRSGF